MKYLAIVSLLVLSARTHAMEQTYESCATTTWEVFDALSSYALGVPEEKQRKKAAIQANVAAAYKLAKDEGLSKPYIAAHVHFKKCAAEVQQRATPSQSPAEQAYRQCALASANRTSVLIRIDQGMPVSEAKKVMPQQLHSLIDTLYRTANESSLTKALADSARAHTSCVEALQEGIHEAQQPAPEDAFKATRL